MILRSPWPIDTMISQPEGNGPFLPVEKDSKKFRDRLRNKFEDKNFNPQFAAVLHFQIYFERILFFTFLLRENN